jgi:hypothetical protein
LRIDTPAQSAREGGPVKRKRPHIKPGGYKPPPSKPLTPEGKRRRVEYLRDWNRYITELLFAETER